MVNGRSNYATQVCEHCGHTLSAAKNSIGHVMKQHAKRCKTATEEERAKFKRDGRWPDRRHVRK